MNFTNTDKHNIDKFLENAYKSNLNGLSKKHELWEVAGLETKLLIERILALDPSDYGFKGKKLPEEPVPTNAVKIDAQTDKSSGEYVLDPNTYMPEKVSAAFEKMANAFSKENPGRKLLVGSGYRSPAFQIVTILYVLAKIYDFDIDRTLKRAAMPRYSQHCSASHTAIDMLNIDGEPSDEEPQKFGESVEYFWLIKNAHKFNFRESYPPNNPDGIMWEPWHWQFLG